MPRPSTAITWSQSATEVWSMVLSGITPALATSTSIRPNDETAASTIARASSSTETSPTTVTMSPSSARAVSASVDRVEVGGHDARALGEEDLERSRGRCRGRRR